MSNGGMMCYRLAAEMSDRIAAIAPVAGTVAVDESKPMRPVPVMHFHGKADNIVPFDGLGTNAPKFLPFKSVEESISIWCEIDGCPDAPTITEFPDTEDDGTTVQQKVWPGKDGAEVVLIVIEGGGHTWPGQKPPVEFLGESTLDISANDLMWEFFQKHPMK